MERRDLVCIVCPRGCRLRVCREGDAVTVEGNACPRGEAYARQETIAPARVLTTTVRLLGGAHPRLPVKTRGSIPKEKLTAAMAALRRVTLRSPVEAGTVVLSDLLGTGVDVVTTASG